MKRIIIAVMAVLCTAQVLNAIPAKPGTFKKVLQDGSVVTLQRHGDEFCHWTTDENGSLVGPVKVWEGARETAEQDAARILARRMAGNAGTKAVKTYHFPVVLVQFSDVTFSVSNPRQAFSDMLNQQGYSANGGTGSVHDYYWENSMQTFNAQFDVYGPYTYNGTCADNEDENDAAKILWDAIRRNDASINWSQYDNDGDNVVDMVFMYYAGYNEAEGNDDTIWPHKYNFGSAGVSTSRLDGKSFDVYACTSELKGTPYYGSGMCGIGTAAHEFSHTQGLPDFYDVNYNTYGDGTNGATYSYDIMCSGGYNNEGRTPPYFTAEERIMMGWLSGYTAMPASGDITVPAVNTNFAYKLETSNTTGDGEYFVFECRSGRGWDAYVEPGLVVYHADKSTKYSITFYHTGQRRNVTTTAYNIWRSYSQFVNASGPHPCFYIVPSADQSSLNYGIEVKLPFPGKNGISYYSPKDWEGNSYDLFCNIAFNAEGSYGGASCPVVTMSRGANFRGLTGRVTNSADAGVAGAKVSIYASGAAPSLIGKDSPQMISGRVQGDLKMTTTTNEDGYYSFDLSGESAGTLDIEVVANGYINAYATFTVEDQLITRNFTLRGINEPIDYTLRKYDLRYGGIGITGFGQTATCLGGVKFTKEELADYVGRQILTLNFAYTLSDEESEGTATAVYGIIDFGTERVLTQQLSRPAADVWNTLDVSGANLTIPAGTDCYFGYVLENCTFGYPWLYSYNEPKAGGFCYDGYSTSNTDWQTASDWYSISGVNILIDVELDDSRYLDYNSIDNPGYGTYYVGQTLTLKLNEAEGVRKPGTAVTWYYDDETVSGTSVTFKYPGTHLIEARFTTTEGKTKIVELEVNVN